MLVVWPVFAMTMTTNLYYPENFWVYPLLEYKILNLSPQFGVHMLFWRQLNSHWKVLYLAHQRQEHIFPDFSYFPWPLSNSLIFPGLPGFSGLESSKPGFRVWVCQWPTVRHVTGLTAVKPVMSPDRQPAYSSLPNCFSCARASSAVCKTPTNN